MLLHGNCRRESGVFPPEGTDAEAHRDDGEPHGGEDSEQDGGAVEVAHERSSGRIHDIDEGLNRDTV
jgi:hypothetical protein